MQFLDELAKTNAKKWGEEIGKRKQVLDTANQENAKRRKENWDTLKNAFDKGETGLKFYLEISINNSAIKEAIEELFATANDSYQALKDAIEAIFRNNSDLASQYGFASAPQNK